MPTSEEDVESLRSSVDKKREDLEKARRARVEKEQGVSNDILAAQLQAEEATLDRQIAAEKAFSTVTAVKEGAEVTISDAKEAMKAAVEGQKADAALVEADKSAPTDENKES